MKRVLLLVGAGVVGVALAWILMPRVDTGADLPPSDGGVSASAPRPVSDKLAPRQVDGPDTPEYLKAKSRPGVAPNPGPSLTEGLSGANPAAALRADRFKTAEAQISQKLSPRWNIVKRKLRENAGDTPSDDALVQVDEIIDAIRAQRRAADPQAWMELVDKQRHVMGLLRQTRSFDDEMQQTFDGMEQLYNEYNELKAQEGVGDGEPGPGELPGAP